MSAKLLVLMFVTGCNTGLFTAAAIYHAFEGERWPAFRDACYAAAGTILAAAVVLNHGEVQL